MGCGQDTAFSSGSWDRIAVRRKAVFFSLLLGMPGFNHGRKAGRKAEMKWVGPAMAEAHLVNPAESQQEKATCPTAASGAVRNLVESDFMINFFNRYHYNHVKHSIKYSGQSVWISVKRND